MRGINGVNDGQQIYSYDAEFKDYNKDEIKSLFSYQPPALDPGVIMSEEIAATMPKAFLYRKLENNRFAFALNTYLGRDYMGSAELGANIFRITQTDELLKNNNIHTENAACDIPLGSVRCTCERFQ